MGKCGAGEEDRGRAVPSPVPGKWELGKPEGGCGAVLREAGEQQELQPCTRTEGEHGASEATARTCAFSLRDTWKLWGCELSDTI